MNKPNGVRDREQKTSGRYFCPDDEDQDDDDSGGLSRIQARRRL